MMSYLKLVANPSDNEAFRRAVSVPRRKLGETTIETLADIARKAGVPLLEAAGRDELLAGMKPAPRTGFFFIKN